jgi:nucleoside-diphosphate-sugar epimerase
VQFLADFVQVRLAAEQAAAAEPPTIPNEPPTVETQPPTIETEPPTIQTQLPTIQTQLPTIAVFCDEWRSAVDVHDVVSAVLRLIEAPDWGAQGGPSAVPAGGVLNLGGPARLSRFELARAVVAELAPGRSAESLGVRPTRKHSAAAPRGGSGVASPADIAMDSSALVAFSGLERACLEATVRRALRADREAATVAQGAQSLKR